MAMSVRPVTHHDQVSVFAHLGELRARLIVSAGVLAIAFAFAFWQNHAVLQVLNRPLANAGSPSLTDSSAPLSDTTGTQQKLRAALDSQRVAFGLLAASPGPLTVTERQALASAAHTDADYLAADPAPPGGLRPVTLGIGEPFSQTVIVSAYFALLLSLPVILWQLYAFIIPAFTPRERRVATPLLTLAPLLFALGLAFGYFVVLPGAVSFLLHFNASSFDTLVQARSYYQFILFTMLATGLFFEIPIAVLGLNRAGILSTRQLRKHRRYAIVAIAALALLLPGSDPVTTLLELIPMLALYELSILSTAALEYRDRQRTRRQAHP
jgi:sec-independent protein translocase protein TatC